MATLPDDGLPFIGNATVVLRHAGLTVLTDPNFVHRGQSVRLGYGLSTERLTDPAVEVDELPPLDLVTVTMDAEQGLETPQTVRPRLAVPIHYNDYQAFTSPIEDFLDAVRRAGLEEPVRYVTHGDTLDLSVTKPGRIA